MDATASTTAAFAAWEQPQTLVEEIRATVRSLR
jgi:hypothetical protein